jgi:hypothetical protein
MITRSQQASSFGAVTAVRPAAGGMSHRPLERPDPRSTMPMPLRSLLALLAAAAFASGLALAHGDGALHGDGATQAEAHPHGRDDDASDDGHTVDHDDAHGRDRDPGDDGHGEDHDDAHGQDDDHAVAGARLLVASADTPTLVVLDLATGRVIARFTTPGVGHVHQLPDPRHAAVLHPDEHRVTIVHSGLSAVDHGDHMDLLEGTPYVLQTMHIGRQPTKLVAHGSDIVVTAAGDGVVAWLDSRLLGISLDYTEIAVAGGEPGALAVVGRDLLVARDGSLERYDRSGALVDSGDGCREPAGAAVVGAEYGGTEDGDADDGGPEDGRALDGGTEDGDAAGPGAATTVLLGCADGVLLVEIAGDGTLVARLLDYPAGSPAGARAVAFVGHPERGVAIGTYGVGLVVVDVAAGTVRAVDLSAAPLDVRFSEGGDVLVVLTGDGRLHRLDPATGEVAASVEVAAAVEPGAPLPSVALLGDVAYVADPAHRRVVEVHVDDMAVERRFDLDVTPGGVAVLAIPGAIRH